VAAHLARFAQTQIVIHHAINRKPYRGRVMLKRIKIWMLLAAPLLVAPLIPGCPLIP